MAESRRHLSRAAGLTSLSALAAIATTLSISMSPSLRFAYPAASGHVALETAAGLIAALAAFLAFGRFRLTRSIADLALVWALGLLGATMLLFFTGPAVVDHPVGRFAIWARALGMLFAALALVAAAFAPDEPSAAGRRRWTQALAAYGVSAGIALALLFVVRPAVAIPDELPVESLTRPLLVGSPALLVWHFLTGVAFAVATVGFVRRCRPHGDALTLALALGMPLAAGASVHSFLFPSPYPDYVFAGDVLRLTFFAVVLAGALAQISTYQRAAERLGMRRERERLARDLHDGPVQELALLQILIDQAAQRVADPAVAMLDEQATGALREWRRAVSAASAEPDGTPLRELLERSAAGLPGVTVEVHTDGDERALDRDAVDDVLYLVREATSNAVRHGGASRVRIDVSAGQRSRVRIEDDGCGFDAGAATGAGHGLRTMRERAERLGGELRIVSSPQGTLVTVEPAGSRRSRRRTPAKGAA